jgi:hypothetical protein
VLRSIFPKLTLSLVCDFTAVLPAMDGYDLR